MGILGKVSAIGCGGFVALALVASAIGSCALRLEQRRQAAVEAKKAEQERVRIATEAAAFAALTPQQHLEAAQKSMDVGQVAGIAQHLSVVPVGCPGLSEAKGRFAKLQAKLKAEREAQEAAREKARKEAERKLHAQWRKEGVSIGMTSERVKLSNWGHPERVNRTISAGGVHEQWVYGHNYLYFEDGILTAIQN